MSAQLGLRPFFSYYGGKWRDAIKHYPAPIHDTVIEPFAGSAGYSLRYPAKKVILCEIDPVIAGVWQYLIRVSSREILAIPDVPAGECVADLKLCQEAEWLVGFWMNRGASRPRKRPSKWMRDKIRPGSFWGDRVRNAIARQVDHIRHWKIHNVSYADCPVAGDATWFVDPPYQTAGKYYAFGSDMLDFQHLGDWCKARPGQVIVCENAGANWLPFRELANVKTTRTGKRSREVIWSTPRWRRRPMSAQLDMWASVTPPPPRRRGRPTQREIWRRMQERPELATIGEHAATWGLSVSEWLRLRDGR